jgi:signal transduction histidine kinase
MEDSGPALDPTSRDHLVQIEKRVRRMQSLLEGILEYSRLGRVEMDAEVVDATEIAGDVIEALSPPAGVTVRIDGSLQHVRFNPVRFYQVLQNLIGNAIQHLGKLTGSVTVSCHDAGAMWQYCVRDDGAGIEERDLDRIFKMFVTLRPRDETASTGIGLTIVRRAVELHGGVVMVRSKPGFGSEFAFTAPKAIPALDELRKRA